MHNDSEETAAHARAPPPGNTAKNRPSEGLVHRCSVTPPLGPGRHMPQQATGACGFGFQFKPLHTGSHGTDQHVGRRSGASGERIVLIVDRARLVLFVVGFAGQLTPCTPSACKQFCSEVARWGSPVASRPVQRADEQEVAGRGVDGTRTRRRAGFPVLAAPLRPATSSWPINGKRKRMARHRCWPRRLPLGFLVVVPAGLGGRRRRRRAAAEDGDAGVDGVELLAAAPQRNRRQVALSPKQRNRRQRQGCLDVGRRGVRRLRRPTFFARSAAPPGGAKEPHVLWEQGRTVARIRAVHEFDGSAVGQLTCWRASAASAVSQWSGKQRQTTGAPARAQSRR